MIQRISNAVQIQIAAEHLNPTLAHIQKLAEMTLVLVALVKNIKNAVVLYRKKNAIANSTTLMPAAIMMFFLDLIIS